MPNLQKIWMEEYLVHWYDTDLNGHINNIRYIDWCLDALTAEWHLTHRIKSLVINYLAEVKTDDTLKISTCSGHESSHFIQGNREDGKAIFRTRLDWGIG